MKHTLTTLLIAATVLVFPLRNPLEAQILVSENFDTGVTFTDWYWTGGSFQNPPTFGEAWNQNSTGQQFFTTSFSPTSFGVGDVLRATFRYNPNSTNIASVRVGLFSGTAATSNGWSQFDSSSISYGWVGYTGSLAILSGNSAASLKTNTTSHAFFGATNGSSLVAESFGTGVLRAGSFTLERTSEAIIATLSEGANFGSLAPVVSYSDASSAITNFNILSFYTTTPSGNVDMRYDTVQVAYEAVPEPSTYALMLLGCVAVLWAVRRARRTSASGAVAD